MSRPNTSVIFCGDRAWKGRGVVSDRLVRLLKRDPIIVHGAARGADEISGLEATLLGLRVVSFPAEWERYGRGAGPIRNQAMLDQAPNLLGVIAFHDHLNRSKGTNDMLNRCLAQSIPCVLFGSNGKAFWKFDGTHAEVRKRNRR